MSKILGLDLGTNSVGWAIRDIQALGNQIIDYGVLTFDKGVASEKGNEFPKVQKRTESRGKRRNYQAEKYRKWELLEFLIDRRMCPLTKVELQKWKGYEKGINREYPKSESFLKWLQFDFDQDGKPDFHLFNKDKHESIYVFREMAISPTYRSVFERNPQILGRVFYQLVQHRGFRGRDEEEAKTMLQGSVKNNTPGRNEIAEYIEKYKTLGAALYNYQKKMGGRIRQRYNLRKDYEDELKNICSTQNISEKDYQKLWKAIIWQRPLRTQKGLVGKCIYERNKNRVQVSHPLYEEYRTWTLINNLKIIPPEGEEKAKYLQKKIYPIFYKAGNDFELNSIIKQLQKDGATMEANFNSNTKVISAKLLKSFQDILGNDWKEKYAWNNIHDRENQPQKKTNSSYNFEDIWHVLNTFDGQENLKSFALEKLILDEVNAEKFSKIKLNKGYATLSLSAIKKLLPYLQRGFLYSQAVYLANLHKVLGEEHITDETIEYFASEIESIIKSNKQEKTLNNIVNSLIQDELNDRNRYSIEIDRELDASEKKAVKTKIIEELGEKSWNALDKTEKQKSQQYVEHQFKVFLKKSVLSKRNVFVEQPRLHDQIFKFLQETYQVPSERKKWLWHPSEQEVYISASDYSYFKLQNEDIYISENKLEAFIKNNPEAEFQGINLKLLGSPEPVSKGFKNPMALKSLHKLRHLLNYLLKEKKIDDDTRIVIEISRELNDANKRKAIESFNKEREKENDQFKKEIIEINNEIDANYDENDKTLIKKLRLWHEQQGLCLYTGKKIKKSDVFNGKLYDLEHTIPASISFDSELKNLTLASKEFNQKIKGKKFPTQLQNYNETATINGKTYQPILRNIEILFGKIRVVEKKRKGKLIKVITSDKIEGLEKQFKEWKNKASWAPTKGYKDYCIQQYHKLKMDLDYWRAKLHTFTLEEYKAGWRNSQLRDTQIVTKYALPYLKTVFKKVSVEKAGVVNAFKEIYEVKLWDEKKDRNLHSHHAIDAATLTLIPPHYDRDKILFKYNLEKDNHTGKVYHEKPKNWQQFSASFIKQIEEDILINNVEDYKTTLPTFKKVRKRGKIEYIRYKDSQGKWQYSLDSQGNKIPKVAKGDTIRGQLHGDSFYGAIKQAKRDENGKILFDDNRKMIVEATPILVIRKELAYKKNADSPGFKSLSEVEKVIVDQALFQMIKKQVEETYKSDFKTAMNEGVYMLNKNGAKVNKIRHIRCKETMKFDTAIKVHNHQPAFVSVKDYKQFTLAKNGENALCLFYQNKNRKAMHILSIGDLAALNFENDRQFFEEPHYQEIASKEESKIPLYAVLRSGQKVLFFEKSKEELKDLSKFELSKRLYKIYQFEGDGRMKFRHHLAAGIDTELKKENKESSSLKLNENQVFLRLTKKEWNFAIDDVDFEMKTDGCIVFKY